MMEAGTLRAAAMGCALLLGSALAPAGASAATVDKQFNTAISRMLMGMKEGAVSVMAPDEKEALVACVQKVFAGIPDEKKKFIVSGGPAGELRARFDKVGLENQARLKQKVRDDCA